MSKTNLSKEKKYIRNSVLQWKRWLLSGKTETLPRKRYFLLGKKIEMPLYSGKLWFLS